MHLISATIRNYRIHRELTLDFDRCRTLIGGPNETGKSTLIEAIHRGLFLRSRVGGDIQRGMVSGLPGVSGHPEVEIRLSAGGREYLLSKRFSGGATGTTKLAEAGGSTWTGDDAETRLASLLAVDGPVGGQGATNKLAQQWAHLWVWQGKSGEDPCEHAGAEHATLLQRLQDTGGAAAMQSECDSRIASHFSQQVDTIFTRQGRAKQGSDLQKAESAISDAGEGRRQAAERVDRLNEAVAKFETASATIHRLKEDLKKLVSEQSEVAGKLKQVDKLTNQEKLEQAEAESAARHHESLKAADNQIAGLVKSISEAEKRLAPKTKELEKLEARASALLAKEKEHEDAYNKACDTARSARLRRELAAAAVRLFEKKSAVTELSEKAGQIRARQQQLTMLRDQLAKLPKIDSAQLKKLQNLENALGKAEAALKAMAAGVEVIFADAQVCVGETSLSAGGNTTVTETTEIAFGDSLRLRIHPGGGDSLAEARQQVSQSREKLQRALDELGLSSIAAASEAFSRISELQKQIDHEETILKGMDAAKVPLLLAQAQEEQTAAQAEVDRRKEQVGHTGEPTDLENARILLADLDSSLQRAETTEKEEKAARDAAQKTARDADQKCKQAAEGVAREQKELDVSRAQLRLLLETNGDDGTRAGQLQKALSARKAKEEALNQTRKTLSQLQPEQLQRRTERLERALGTARQQQEDASRERIEAQTILRSNGGEDPAADLALADARLESARQQLDSVRRKAEALRLLDELFAGEQRALADQFTRPLVEKVTGYLQCLFGPEARATLTFGENSFSALQLVRGGNGTGAMPFENLSGGAREQVAAAVRLAMAEVLAADHGDCLPVVFDDAFAYSDSDRVNTLQGMLDLAASRGLQLIVLTCNPSDYAGLGARQVILSAPTLTVGPFPAPPPTESGADGGTDVAFRAEPASRDQARETHSREVDQAGDAANATSSNRHPTPPVSEEQRQRFLDALRKSGSCGNATLRATLGWDEPSYAAVKEDLVERGQVQKGKGRGGSVSLSREAMDGFVQI